jgi:excisionase family DNA binding protein
VSRLLNKEEVAREFGVHRRTIEAWQKQGLPAHKKGNAYRFDPERVRVWMKANARTGEVGRPPEADALSGFGVEAGQPGALKERLGKAELAKRLALARLYNFKYEKERGNYLLASEVRTGSVQSLLAVRAGLMSLAGRLASQLYNRDVREIERRIDEACRQLLEDFARGFPIDRLEPEVVARCLGVPLSEIVSPEAPL